MRIAQRVAAGRDGASDDRLDQLFELFARDFPAVAAALRELDIDLCHGLRRKRNLGFDHRLAYGLNGFRLLAQIGPCIAGDIIERDRDQEVVNVVAAQMGIAIGGDHLKDAFMQLENGDVEGSAAEIVDGDDAFFLAIETIGQGGGCGLIDQAQNFKARHASRILGRLPLSIIEVGRHGDHCLGHRRAKITFRVALELAQDVRGNFRRRELRIPQANAQHFAGLDIVDQAEGKELQLLGNIFDPAAHEPLDRVNGPLRRCQ